MKTVKAMVLTGYGLNCDNETDFSLHLAGADVHRMHINQLIHNASSPSATALEGYQILVFGGGFSWADDHGAGVLMASKMKRHLGPQLKAFVDADNLILGICNGFQALVNLGLLPGFDGRYQDRKVALTHNNSGNFIDAWVNLTVNPKSPNVFTKGIHHAEFPIRHGEGKFYAADDTIQRLFQNNQVVLQYADHHGTPAGGRQPLNPNGSLSDIAGICDPTGRIFGLMPHPEAFNHFTNHPDWPRRKLILARRGESIAPEEGGGIGIFRNAVDYFR